MLVFRTQLPLKDSITGSQCLELFLKWISEDPRYSLCEIPYEPASGQDFDFQQKYFCLTIRHYQSGTLRLSACRFQNRAGCSLWQSDCIYYSINGEPWILIEQRRSRSLPDEHSYRIRKPHIVRMLIENEFCKDDNGIPITDLRIDAEAPFSYDRILSGNSHLPCVLICCDSSGAYGVNCRYLAAQLGGMAHTFVQSSADSAPSDGCAVHGGRICISIPSKGLSQSYCPADFENDRVLTWQIINDIRTELTKSTPVYDWERVLSLIADSKDGSQPLTAAVP